LVQIDDDGDCKVYGFDTVKAIYFDHQQQLWLGLGPGKGLAKYDVLTDSSTLGWAAPMADYTKSIYVMVSRVK
jgi:hypothetical protein